MAYGMACRPFPLLRAARLTLGSWRTALKRPRGFSRKRAAGGRTLLRRGCCCLLGKSALAACGVLFLLQIGLAVFGLPAPLSRWVTAAEWEGSETATYVIVLGGAGIPSESGLMRTYYAAHLGTSLTGAVFVVSLPTEGVPGEGPVGLMRDELVMRGIPAAAVRMEQAARNTHEQAVNVAALLGAQALQEPVLLVTSPTHMRRALLAFRKAGFTRVAVSPARPAGVDADVGPATGIRYAFWVNLERQVRICRELCALAYYKARGWI